MRACMFFAPKCSICLVKLITSPHNLCSLAHSGFKVLEGEFCPSHVKHSNLRKKILQKHGLSEKLNHNHEFQMHPVKFS